MTEDPAVAERRTALRRQINIPVWVEELPSRIGRPVIIQGRTRDVSHRGAFLWVPPVFSVGQRLRLDMGVATDEGHSLGLQIKCEAEVVRLQPAVAPDHPSGVAVRILQFDAPRPVQYPEI
jgi:PilZ domain